MKSTNLSTVVIALVLALVAYSSLFVVDQRDVGVVMTLQKVTRVVTDPGLHVKWPYPIDDVVLIDHRVRTSDSRIRGKDNVDATRYLTSDQSTVLVKLAIKWQVTDPARFLASAGTDGRRSEEPLDKVIHAGLAEEIGHRTLAQVVAGDRQAILTAVRQRTAETAGGLGIAIVDISFVRVDLARDQTEHVYERMDAERHDYAARLRSGGSAEEERIKAEADGRVTVIRAQAYQTAQNIMGEGDARAAQIYSEAYSRDPQFYAFYKSLEAYRASFRDKSDVVIADPNSDFFRFLKNPGSAPASARK